MVLNACRSLALMAWLALHNSKLLISKSSRSKLDRDHDRREELGLIRVRLVLATTSPFAWHKRPGSRASSPTSFTCRLSNALFFPVMPQDAAQLSCEQCKRRKTRCDKNSPCSACRAGGLTCVSVQRARLPRGKTGNSKGKHAALEDKVARLESLVERLETQLHADGNGADGIFTSASGPTAIVNPVQCASRIESFVARDFWLALSNEVSYYNHLLCCFLMGILSSSSNSRFYVLL